MLKRTRWNWTIEDENRLCFEVISAEAYDLLQFNKESGRDLDVYWDQIAARLWPGIKATGHACRKRYEECKGRYFEEMKRDLCSEESGGEVTADELAKHDDAWAEAEALAQRHELIEKELATATHNHVVYLRDILDAVEVNVASLCRAWDVPVQRSEYDLAHHEKE